MELVHFYVNLIVKHFLAIWEQQQQQKKPKPLEKTLESPLDCEEIQLVHPKGDQSWVFTGKTDVEAETPILRPFSCEELTHWKRL